MAANGLNNETEDTLAGISRHFRHITRIIRDDSLDEEKRSDIRSRLNSCKRNLSRVSDRLSPNKFEEINSPIVELLEAMQQPLAQLNDGNGAQDLGYSAPRLVETWIKSI